MNAKMMVAVAVGLLAGITATLVGVRDQAGAQEKQPKHRLEYKVVFVRVGYIKLVQKDRDGKVTQVEVGTKNPDETMTKQFNALAADGWEYVGPVDRRPNTAEMLGGAREVEGLLVLFKRAAR